MIKIKLKITDYKRKASKYIKETKYFWMQFNKILITIKFIL